MKASDLALLANLKDCDFVRYSVKDDTLSLTVVGDNEEGESIDHHDDEEDPDCCDGLNGHLFTLFFKGVKDLHAEGEECDNYKTIKVEEDGNHLLLLYEGTSFDGPDGKVSLSFSYDSFSVRDDGEIQGPDA